MGTTGKYCSDCCHYIHGNETRLCALGRSYAGYLREPCRMFNMGEEMPTKRCPMCGKEKGVDEFYVTKQTKDGLSECCKECRPHNYLKKGKS